MNCKEVRNIVIDLGAGEVSPETREHVAACSGCGRLWRAARLVDAGFRALAEEAAPVPTLGFSARVLRRLRELQESGRRSEFFETVGRRFVYATLALTLVLLLSLVMSATGPVRGVPGTEFLGMQTENQVPLPDPISGDAYDSHDVISGTFPE